MPATYMLRGTSREWDAIGGFAIQNPAELGGLSILILASVGPQVLAVLLRAHVENEGEPLMDVITEDGDR